MFWLHDSRIEAFGEDFRHKGIQHPMTENTFTSSNKEARRTRTSNIFRTLVIGICPIRFDSFAVYSEMVNDLFTVKQGSLCQSSSSGRCDDDEVPVDVPPPVVRGRSRRVGMQL